MRFFIRLPWLALVMATLVLCGASVRTFASSWISAVTGASLKTEVLEPAAGNASGARPLIIYLCNLPSERVGTEADETILRDFRAQGYRVLCIDYAKHPKARMPFLNQDLGLLRDQVRAGRLLPGMNVDQAHCFIIPSGHRLLRDVLYWKDGVRPLGLDIAYPSKPSHPMGTVLEFSCDNRDRMGNTSLSICSDTLLDAFATEGFAVAMADHPVAPPYKGIDAMPDCARKIKAAVRSLRAALPALGANGKIVPVGFSRGSGMALLLVSTEGLAEFEGFGENPKQSSAVQGAVVMSGRFTYLDLLPGDKMIPRYEALWGRKDSQLEVWRRHGALDYLQKPTLPLLLTINCTEGPDALHQMEVLRKRLGALGSEASFMMDPVPRGHKVTLVPEILDAMNRYLRLRLE